MARSRWSTQRVVIFCFLFRAFGPARYEVSELVSAEDSCHGRRVQKTSLAQAKAHLSVLVDQAERHHRRILILRHGKPAAAIVPVDVAIPPKPRLSVVEIEELFAGLGWAASEDGAVNDLLSGRR
jgi:prevent-host-death family protein